MIDTIKINTLLEDYDQEEIEQRLNSVFNGYLGCDTGDPPAELQINHTLILSIIDMFRAEAKN